VIRDHLSCVLVPAHHGVMGRDLLTGRGCECCLVRAFWRRQSVRYMKHIKKPNRSTLGRVSTLVIGSTVLPQIGMPDRIDSINRSPSVGTNTVRASQHLWSKADSSDPPLDCTPSDGTSAPCAMRARTRLVLGPNENRGLRTGDGADAIYDNGDPFR
jgi:hypothetical protein